LFFSTVAGSVCCYFFRLCRGAGSFFFKGVAAAKEDGGRLRKNYNGIGSAGGGGDGGWQRFASPVLSQISPSFSVFKCFPLFSFQNLSPLLFLLLLSVSASLPFSKIPPGFLFFLFLPSLPFSSVLPELLSSQKQTLPSSCLFKTFRLPPPFLLHFPCIYRQPGERHHTLSKCRAWWRGMAPVQPLQGMVFLSSRWGHGSPVSSLMRVWVV